MISSDLMGVPQQLDGLTMDNPIKMNRNCHLKKLTPRTHLKNKQHNIFTFMILMFQDVRCSSFFFCTKKRPAFFSPCAEGRWTSAASTSRDGAVASLDEFQEVLEMMTGQRRWVMHGDGRMALKDGHRIGNPMGHPISDSGDFLAFCKI